MKASSSGVSPRRSRRIVALLPIACLALAAAGCLPGPGAPEAPAENMDEVSDYGWVPSVPRLPEGWPSIRWPRDNPFTPAKAILGRRLFYEMALSRDHTVSCSWCHSPRAAFSDFHHSEFSSGVHGQLTHRNPPTLANVAFGTAFGFDGREPTLERQALVPLFAGNEMDMTEAEILARLKADTLYVRLFRQAYGSGAMTLQGVVKALATYQRTLISHRSPYDRWRAGDEDALSPAEKRGAQLFLGDKAGCFRCHVPPLFTDGGYHNNGLDEIPADWGRGAFTGKPADRGRFKTPTLRNIDMTGPYMHDGRFSSLENVVEHYNSGGKPSPHADPRIRPLGLSPDEVEDLARFLTTLTDSAFLEEPEP